jgi:hypothetical protein
LGLGLRLGPHDKSQDNTQPEQGLIRGAKAEGLLLITTVSVYVFLLSFSRLTLSLFMSSFVVKRQRNDHHKRMAFPVVDYSFSFHEF